MEDIVFYTSLSTSSLPEVEQLLTHLNQLGWTVTALVWNIASANANIRGGPVKFGNYWLNCTTHNSLFIQAHQCVTLGVGNIYTYTLCCFCVLHFWIVLCKVVTVKMVALCFFSCILCCQFCLSLFCQPAKRRATDRTLANCGAALFSFLWNDLCHCKLSLVNWKTYWNHTFLKACLYSSF